MAYQQVLRYAGLSPRVRGNPRGTVRRVGVVRSIPACAGEPMRSRIGRKSASVYPRVCGGTISPYARLMEQEGLSPRVRGNPRLG